jgi:hypothetical protein
VRVDECFRLDLRDMRRHGLFTHPVGSAWALNPGGPPHFRVTYGLSVDAATRKLVIVNHNYDGGVVQTAPLEWMACHFGGGRWWFSCPGDMDGRVCRRRCRVLHRPPRALRFGCRICYRLTNKARQRHRDRFYEGIERPLALMERSVADLGSRSPRRKLRGLLRGAPELLADLIARDLEARGVVPCDLEGGTDG